MSDAAVAADLIESLNVKSNLTAKITLYGVRGFDYLTELSNLSLGEILRTGIRIDTGLFENVTRTLYADTVDIGQGELNALVVRNINTSYTSHVISPFLFTGPLLRSNFFAFFPKESGLALSLLVLGIFANNHHVAFSLDDFALFANLLDGRLNFHCFIPFLFRLFFSPSDTSLGEVISRNLNGYGIAGKNFDIVHAKLARNVCGHDKPIGQLYLEGGVGKCFNNNTVFKFNQIVFCHDFLLVIATLLQLSPTSVRFSGPFAVIATVFS
jgi:hypothetical protein